MTEFEVLDRAVATLKEIITNFPVTAVCRCDFKSTDEKIADTRDYLKHLKAQALCLKVGGNARTLANISANGNSEDTLYQLERVTTSAVLVAKILNFYLHGYTLETEVSDNKETSETSGKIHSGAHKLFALNSSTTNLQMRMEKLYEEQLDLKMKCQKSLFEYQKFIKERKRLRNEKLQEMNPEMAFTEDRMYGTLKKINVMKRLITNFIAASGHILIEEPKLADTLEQHRELISIETVLNISNASEES